MINKNYTSSIPSIVKALHQHQVIAYPSESVFSLGCDPSSEKAIKSLLSLKKRSWEKGFILVASHYNQLSFYIDDSFLTYRQKSRIFTYHPGKITWIMPARQHIPWWLTGKFNSLAVRISSFEPIQNLCIAWGKPLVSTSANLTGQPPARTSTEVKKKFNKAFPIMEGHVGGRLLPSEIRDAITNVVIRHG